MATNEMNQLDIKTQDGGSYSFPVVDQTARDTASAAKTAAESAKKTAEGITVPTKLSELTNDAGYMTGYTETDPTVPSWAKQSKKPSYTAAEVGAQPAGNYLTEEELSEKGYATETFVSAKIAEAELSGSEVDLSGFATKDDIPKKTSQLTNDSGFITDFTETDPTVPAWAKAATKPAYTAAEVGARPSTWMPSASDVGADPSGTAAAAVTAHNTEAAAHNDIRLLITNLTTRLNTLADSDDTTLDQLSELVAYIKDNRELIDGITTGKVNVADIVNNLTTNVATKPLSAAQGVALKALIDAITIPTALPNPKKLTFTGGATGEYDGSSELAIEIPEGAECNIQRIESESSNYVYLRDLASGLYLLYGYFRPFTGSSTRLVYDNVLASVAADDTGSHILTFDTVNSKINFVEILVDSTQTSGFTYTRTAISLLDLHGLLARAEALEGLISANGINLIDRTTGKACTVYVDNGKLTMEIEEPEEATEEG